MLRTLRHRIEWAGLSLLSVTVSLLPRVLIRRIGRRFGRLAWLLMGYRRNLAKRNLSRAMPHLANGDIARIVRGVFENLGQTACEAMRAGRDGYDDILSRVDSDGVDWLHRAMDGSRGAILVTGHFGNWEILPAWIRALGYPIDVVVKPARNPLVDRWITNLRAKQDIGIIPTRVGTLGIARSLKRRRFVGMLADQYAGKEGIEVEFFGRRASTPRGPAALALRVGCPIITGVLIRRPGGRFLAQLDGPVEYRATGDTERDVRAVTQEIVSRLERQIRLYPDQWLWTHRRWRDGARHPWSY